MWEFGKGYGLRGLESLIERDGRVCVGRIESVTNEVLKVNEKEFREEVSGEIEWIDCE